jgi:hypothetical protein
MALIISDIESGRDLFFDSESFLSEVGDADLDRTVGGVTPGAAILTAVVIFGTGAGIGYLAYKLTH